MLVKKPYAFLIKNFRLIHGVILFLALYLGKRTLDIYDFYNRYVNTHAFTDSTNLVGKYVSPVMYVACVITILVCALIYFILSLKNKNKSLYFYTAVYYIALFAFYIFMAISLSKLHGSRFDVETVRAYRDISFMFLLPQLVIIFVLFGRTIGFNIKQFDFKKDLEEMNIEISDSEEVELTLGSDTYKFARSLRKFLRLSKYFVLENKLFVIIVCSAFIFILSLIGFSKINVYADKNYEKAAFLANGLTFDIKDSYITSTDKTNQIIKKDKYYLLIRTNIQNKTTMNMDVNRETFRLSYKNELLYADMSLAEKFLDFGEIFKTNKIKSGYDYDCFVIFELDKSQLATEYILNVLSNASEGYKSMIVKPKNLEEIVDNGSKSIPNKITFTDSILNNSSVTLTSYQIEEKFMEKYNYVFDGEEKVGTYTVIPDKTSAGINAILRIESVVEMDETTNMSKYIKFPADFYKYFGFISYRALGVSGEFKLIPKETIYENNKYSYFEVPARLMDADKIQLILLVRGQKYTFILK